MRSSASLAHRSHGPGLPLLILMTGLAIHLVLAGSSARADELQGAWTEWVPYQYEKSSKDGATHLSGFDVEVMRAASRLVGQKVTFEQVPRQESLEEVQRGTLDFALAASPGSIPDQEVRFSRPYRQETIIALVRRGQSYRWTASTPRESLKLLREHGGTLGIEDGRYYGPAIADILQEPSERPWIIKMSDATTGLEDLLTGKVDVLYVDRLAGPGVAAELHALGQIEQLGDIVHEARLGLMFSARTVPAATVDAYNIALESLESSGEIQHLARQHLVPRMLTITLGAGWFSVLEIIGTIAFAISGVIIARREHYDIVGAAVLAFLPALGGGVMRDLISNRFPLGIFRAPEFILIVLGTVLAGFVFYWLCDVFQKEPRGSRPERKFRWRSTAGLLEVTDAIGLASFTILGVTVAVEQHCEPLWLWGPIMACLTGAGGGVLRDILRARADIPTLKGSLYPELALIGGYFFSLAILRRNIGLNISDLTHMTLFICLCVFFARLLVVHFRIPSLFLGNPFKPTQGNTPSAPK